MLNNTLMIVNSKLLWPNLSMSDGFRGKHKVSTYSHLSIEVGREDITNLLFEAEGLIKIWEFLKNLSNHSLGCLER